MAEFVVDTQQLRSYADQLSALQRELDSVAVRLGAMQLGSIIQIKASTALVARVGDCKWAAAHQSDNLSNLARGLDDIAELYDRYETNLSEPKTQAQADEQAAAEVPQNIFDYLKESITPLEIIKWLGGKSVPFTLITAISSFMKGDAKGIVGGLKSLVSAIGNGTKAIFGSSGVNADWFSKLVGISGQGVGGLGDSWQKFLDGMNLGKQTTAAGKVSTVCKWAGYALTFISDGIENYNEFDGDWTNMRFWGETIIEGAVDVGLSIGAGVLIAAALPASAPAIVVGAAAAGVVWVANEACEWITGGRDIAEVVSDAVCDTAEWVGDRVNDIGNAISEAGESIAEGFNNAYNTARNWIGGLFG